MKTTNIKILSNKIRLDCYKLVIDDILKLLDKIFLFKSFKILKNLDKKYNVRENIDSNNIEKRKNYYTFKRDNVYRLNYCFNNNIKPLYNTSSRYNTRSKKQNTIVKINNFQNTINYIEYYKGINNFNKFNINKKPGNDIIKKYEVIKEINRGAFGIVLECKDHENLNRVAVKEPKKYEYNKLLEIEYIIYQKVGYKTIYFPKIYEFINDNQNKLNYLVMEKLDINLLLWRKKYVKENVDNLSDCFLKKIKIIIKQILQGTDFLHSKNLIHGDLKPENIVFRSDSFENIKIVDLGNCMNTYEINNYKNLQTRYYRAPECILDIFKGKEIDIWSIGCIICELINNKILFCGTKDEMQLFSILEYIEKPHPNYFAKSRLKHLYFDYKSEPKMPVENYRYMSKSFNNIYNNTLLIDLLKLIFVWDIKFRISINNILNHQFLK